MVKTLETICQLINTLLIENAPLVKRQHSSVGGGNKCDDDEDGGDEGF